MYQTAIYAVVALWLSPGSLWRPVALVLLVQWSIGEAVYAFTHDQMPMAVYVVGDLAVVATVLAARSHWSDWLIIAVYPAVWYIYTWEGVTAWYWLYAIALMQFLVAGPWPNIGYALRQYTHGPMRTRHEGL